eukprot:364243-Chlamydomonas_euryale.AAC.1
MYSSICVASSSRTRARGADASVTATCARHVRGRRVVGSRPFCQVKGFWVEGYRVERRPVGSRGLSLRGIESRGGGGSTNHSCRMCQGVGSCVFNWVGRCMRFYVGGWDGLGLYRVGACTVLGPVSACTT